MTRVDGVAAARTADYTAHAPEIIQTEALDSDAWVEFLGVFLEGFPDLHLEVQDSSADEGMVAQRILFTGRHRVGHGCGAGAISYLVGVPARPVDRGQSPAALPVACRCRQPLDPLDQLALRRVEIYLPLRSVAPMSNTLELIDRERAEDGLVVHITFNEAAEAGF